MSHSYVKRYRALSNSPVGKKYANHVLRRNRTFDANGNVYKKLFDSWNINDGPRSEVIPKHPSPEGTKPSWRTWTAKQISKVRRK